MISTNDRLTHVPACCAGSSRGMVRLPRGPAVISTSIAAFVGGLLK
jgi:hypothetical protein